MNVRDQRAALLDDASVRGAEFGRTHAALVDRWLTELLGDAHGCAVVAVGGYGRQELAPLSDLDIVLLHASTEIGAIADRLWYPIWDAGFRLDHSVRTVKQAVAVADHDLKAALGLLDLRWVAGERSLVDDLHQRAASQWRTRFDRWAPQLEVSVRERHARTEPVAFALEPDLKEGRGGLRDVTALRALARATQVVELSPVALEAWATLFDVRVGLQRLTGRADDRLLLDYQDELAPSLGIANADDLLRRVSTAARTVTWHLDDAWRAVTASRKGPRRRSSAGRDIALAPGIVRRDDEIALTADAAPASDVALLLQVASLAARHRLSIARPTMQRLAEEAAALAPTVWPDEARTALVELLGAGEATVAVFETLDQYELVSRILPEWDAVRSHPQRNAFHRFTVDRHLVETAARAAPLVDRVQRPDLLLVGAWLHDLGKGFPGDHTEVGIGLMRTIANRMGFEPGDVEALVAMVRHHLLLPAVATSRDLDDPATIDGVATTVGDLQLLDLLHALTEADSLATGPTAWSAWKAELVASLVGRAGDALRGVRHVASTATPDADEALAARAASGLLVEGSRSHLVVAAPDQPGLFSSVVGVLTWCGHDVRTARARSFGTTAISEFDLRSHLDEEPDWTRFEHELRAALVDRAALEAGLVRRAEHQEGAGRLRRPRAAQLPDAQVIIDNEATPTATVLEIHAVDQVGVLYRIAQALAELGLDIRHAKVSTLGVEVIDTFYVVANGQAKVTAPAEQAVLTEALLRAVGLQAVG